MFNIFLQPNKIIDTPPIDNVYIFFLMNFAIFHLVLICLSSVTLFSSLFFGGFFFYDSKQTDLYAFSIFMLPNSFNF